MSLVSYSAQVFNTFADNFINEISREGFLEANAGSKLKRLVVSVGAVWASLAALNFAVPLALGALAEAPFFLALSVTTMVFGCCVPPVLLFLIPIAVWSLPAFIQGVGSTLMIALGVLGLTLAGKSLSII